MKHTPGPWKVSFTKTGDAIFAQDRPICFAPAAGYVPNFVVGRDEVQANMHLVAAAPDLLEALETLYYLVSEVANPDAFDNGVYAPNGKCEGDVLAGEIIEQARIAIAKAKGERE